MKWTIVMMTLTSLVINDAQIPTKKYVDWKVVSGGAGTYPGSYPIIEGDLSDSCVTSIKVKDGTLVDTDISSSAGIKKSKLNLSGSTWDDFN